MVIHPHSPLYLSRKLHHHLLSTLSIATISIHQYSSPIYISMPCAFHHLSIARLIFHYPSSIAAMNFWLVIHRFCSFSIIHLLPYYSVGFLLVFHHYPFPPLSIYAFAVAFFYVFSDAPLRCLPSVSRCDMSDRYSLINHRHMLRAY